VVNRTSPSKALDHLRFPVLLKPNVGGSGAGIVRFDTREDAIVRIEILGDEYLYAIRIVRETGRFNLRPADLCQVPAPGGPASATVNRAACPVTMSPSARPA
jgi:hypothetical protein